MKIEKLKGYVGLPVVIRKNPNDFILFGVVYEADETDNTIKFVTNQKSSYINADSIIEITESNRTAEMERCNKCCKCWYRKTAYDLCPFCEEK